MVAFVRWFDGQNSGFLGNEPEKKIPWNHEVSCKHPSIQCWDIVTATMVEVDATNISTSSTFIHLWGSQGLKCSPLALKQNKNILPDHIAYDRG